MGRPASALVASLVVVTYVAAAALGLFAINRGVPHLIEQVLSALALPLFFIFIPLYPLFERLGLMAGEYWRLPSVVGLIVGTLAYALATYVAVATFGRIR